MSDSDKKTYVIIPDIHLQWEKAEKIVKSSGADFAIYLGDYFDSFTNTADSIAATADWLHHSVHVPNRIHLFGNHDIWYMSGNKTCRCSGNEQWKLMIIDDLMKSEDWRKIKFHHWVDNILFTHAGLHRKVVEQFIGINPYTASDIRAFLKLEEIQAMKSIFRSEDHWFWRAGFSRGGGEYVGGITWCDFGAEFYPVNGINQIFGHTPLNWPAAFENEVIENGLYNGTPSIAKNNFNLDLDTHLAYYATYTTGEEIKLHQYKDL